MRLTCLSATALALCLSAGLVQPALAQDAPLSQDQFPLPAPTGLPWAPPPIPAPVDADYPGTIGLQVDLTDLSHKVIRTTQTMPVQPGHLVLLYPAYLPGTHAVTGPIQLLSGLTVTANGQRIEWLRDTVNPRAFHLRIPEGVSRIEVRFEWLTQPDSSNWRVVMTDNLVNLQWEKALLYPAGYNQSRIMFDPSIVLPAGWSQASALTVEGQRGDVVDFATINLEHLADSPIFAGRHHRRIDIDAGGRSPVHLNVLGDTAASLNASPEWIARYEALVDQADLLFGARHFDHYEFLFGLSNDLGGIGLEHHRSSENTGSPDYFTASNPSFGTRGLLPHEYVHSWNGKFRRPSDEYVPNFNVPTQNSLLWVYEGQTQYWGDVLTIRSGLGTLEEGIINVAGAAAFYENQPGRQWRALQDTNNQMQLGYRLPNPWPSWMRTHGDYYRESMLIWLDADTLIRELSGDTRSLDDFARSFFGSDDGVWEATPYTFDEVVQHLNAVQPYDWRNFLRDRLDAVGPDARAPLDGLERAGWRLTYVDQLTAAEQRMMGGWENDFQYSLGFSLSGNRIVNVRWGGLAFEADIGAGWELVAVNDRTASARALRDAVTRARTSTAPIRMVIKKDGRFRTIEFDYHDGLRYPRLVRIEGTRDRLSEILAARSN